MITVAKSAAQAAGKILIENYGKLSPHAIRQKAANDFISFVDEQSEDKIISIIKETYPAHSFLAEESGLQQHSDTYQWIIDPLDGTTNYIHQIPVFAVSIGLKLKDELILGVIYNPVSNEMFWAEKGKGAFLNDSPIQVTNKDDISRCLIATGFPFKAKQHLPAYLEAFAEIFLSCRGMRRMGAAAIDLAYVAAGRFDGFWEFGLSPWDVAAGAVIIREAGGMVSDFWNKPFFLHNNYIVASNGNIHKDLLYKIQKAFPFYIDVYEEPKI
ncbi:MAG TPA: inositol monophosphatase [Calditrichaeota bacterium]|nr:inositol monophosphatase [Calditrichota bacterium]